MVHIEKAERKSTPLLISLAAPSGGGKTYGALLLAAGLAGEGGKIGFVDTENMRGSMYADSSIIKDAMPQGYDIAYMQAPFSPESYIEHARAFDKENYDVIIFDSITHEYEGPGGLEEIASIEKTGWLKAKLRHRKMMYALSALNADVIFCVRARGKVKVTGRGEDRKYTDIGIQPVCEKNFMFEMTLSMLLSAGNNVPVITKCPDVLLPYLPSNMTKITKDVGIKIREWRSSGAEYDKQLRALQRDCRDAAMIGSVELADFYRSLDANDKGMLSNGTGDEFQEEVRALATEADRVTAETAMESDDNPKLFDDEK